MNVKKAFWAKHKNIVFVIPSSMAYSTFDRHVVRWLDRSLVRIVPVVLRIYCFVGCIPRPLSSSVMFADTVGALKTSNLLKKGICMVLPQSKWNCHEFVPPFKRNITSRSHSPSIAIPCNQITP